MEPLEDAGSDARHESFTSLYDATVDEVYRFVHQRCRDHALAEDIIQETYLQAVRTEHAMNVSIGWLKRVARNRLFDVLRRQMNYQSKLRLVGSGDDQATEIDVAERLAVEEAMTQLSVDHRLVLTLHYLDGLTIPAMADALDRSPKAVEGLVTRARRALRSELEGARDV